MSLPSFVMGITISNDDLYVALKHSPNIDVYDIDTLVRRRQINVNGLVWACDIVAHENVLYVSEVEDKVIHRIQLPDEVHSNCTVNSRYLTMSINQKGNVLVTCWDLNKIIEYTPIGSCVRGITVNAINGVHACLQHAIQLDHDRFLICHTSPRDHRVCVIDQRGRLMQSFGGESESRIGQMRGPVYVAVDRNGFILIADCNNHRIIQLTPSLEFLRELIPEDVGLKEPRRMHLHEKTGRLYISEHFERNIVIFSLYRFFFLNNISGWHTAQVPQDGLLFNLTRKWFKITMFTLS